MDSASLEELVLQHESLLRLGSFCVVFVVMAAWETFRPRRQLMLGRLQRWGHNLGLFLINTLVVRILFPAAAVGFALSALSFNFGLFNWLDWPYWLEVLLAVLLLDLAIYAQHLAMHHVPILWRLHRVHHADLDIDLTTGSRFHTVEILLSMLIKWGVILLLGPAVLAVLIFEILLNGMAVFNHSNVSLPKSLDRVVRYLLVTPDMHRVHHSIERAETDSNFGFNLSLWDRLFRTYRDQPRMGHDDMVIGISEFRDPAQVDRLPGMLALPFTRA